MTNVDVSSVFAFLSGVLKYFLLKPTFHFLLIVLCFPRKTAYFESFRTVQENCFLLLVFVMNIQFEEQEQKVHNGCMWLRVKRRINK